LPCIGRAGGHDSFVRGRRGRRFGRGPGAAAQRAACPDRRCCLVLGAHVWGLVRFLATPCAQGAQQIRPAADADYWHRLLMALQTVAQALVAKTAAVSIRHRTGISAAAGGATHSHRHDQQSRLTSIGGAGDRSGPRHLKAGHARFVKTPFQRPHSACHCLPCGQPAAWEPPAHRRSTDAIPACACRRRAGTRSSR